MDKKPYVIHYDDGTYHVLDLTPKDYDAVTNCIVGNYSHVLISIGFLKLTNIKMMVEWVEPKQEEPDPREGDPDNLDPETKEWLRKQRILEMERDGDDD